MYIGHDGDMECISDLAKYFQCFLVTYTGKRIKTATVGFSVTSFESKRDIQPGSYLKKLMCEIKSHILVLYNTWTCQQEKITCRTFCKVF